MNAQSPSFREHYRALVASGAIEADQAQASAVEAFTSLEDKLAKYRPSRSGGLLKRLFTDRDKDASPR